MCKQHVGSANTYILAHAKSDICKFQELRKDILVFMFTVFWACFLCKAKILQTKWY